MDRRKIIILLISLIFCLLTLIFSYTVMYADSFKITYEGDEALLEKLSEETYGIVILDAEKIHFGTIKILDYNGYFVYANNYNHYIGTEDNIKEALDFKSYKWINGTDMTLIFSGDNIKDIVNIDGFSEKTFISGLNITDPFYTNLSEFLLSFSVSLFLILFFFNLVKNDLVKTKNNILKAMFYSVMSFLIVFTADLLVAQISDIANIGFASENQILIEKSFKSSGFIFSVLSSVILAPVLEELIFRKAIFKIIKSDKIALIVSSIVFGILHLIFETDLTAALIYALSYISSGFILGLFYLKSGKNIFVPIIAHIIINLFAATMILL